ncbi:MAG: zf-HC2 domain-containing protein [Candidatus Eremiobacteraeota bacterium]|nr:zf-HC2 domain-containing protein [Candidatus Eremiobacteraeota bacterium]
MTAHIGEDAALYALGLLDEREQATVDAHVATCQACALLLAQAYDDVAAMAAAQPQFKPPPQRVHAARRWQPALAALAAAFVLALLPSAYFYRENVAMHQAMVADASAMARVASTPHRVAEFRGTSANVMYGADGSWYCVVVRGAKKPMDVAWMHDGRQTMLGTAVPHGDVAILYLPQSHRMDQLALLADDRMVGQARLLF